MTVEDLQARHKSDTQAVKLLLENGKIDPDQFENEIVRIDNSLFESLGIMPSFESVSVVDRINAYSDLDPIIDNIKAIGR